MNRLFDQEARDRARKRLDETLLVEASAGTGKTTTMLGRILSLLTTPTAFGERPARLAEIVAITFTERAGQELRDRLRANLFAAVAEGEPTGREFCRQALNDLEEAPIGTIHALCAKILRQYPIEAGVDVEFRVVEEQAAGDIWEEAWKEWVAREFSRADLPRVVQRSIVLGLTPDDFRDIASQMRSYPGQPIHEILRSGAPTRPDDGAIQRLLDLLPRDGVDDRGKKLRESTVETVGRYEEFVRALISATTPEERSRRLLRPLPPSVPKSLEALRERINHLRAEYTDGLAVGVAEWLGQPATGFLDAYEQAKQRLGCLDFNDLLLKTRDLVLRRADIRRELQGQYRAIIVDEFQDTDPIQAEFIVFLSQQTAQSDREMDVPWHEARLVPGKLCVVGDPKQSIYRFRGADIETYTRTAALIGEANRCHLLTNFRSHPGIIGAVNEIFGQPGVFASQDEPEEARSFRPVYQRLEAGQDAEYGPSERVIWLETPSEREDTLGSGRPVEASLVAAAVERMVAEGWPVRDPETGDARAVRWGDIALLCRTWARTEMFENEFRQLGIPYRVVGGKGLYEREEVVRLISIIKALEQPRDAVSVVAALRSVFFGVSDTDLAQAALNAGSRFDYTDTPNEKLPNGIADAFGFLRKMRSGLAAMRPSQVLQGLFQGTGVLATLSQAADGEQAVANLLQILDDARRYESEGMASLRGFCRRLESLRKRNADGGEATLSDEQGGLVQLLSIHKAKGLEFPVVILLDLAGRLTGANRKTRLAVIRHGGNTTPKGALYVKKLPGGTAYSTRTWKEVSAEDEKRESAELTRLLYVALTRARDYLLLPRVAKTKAGTWQALIESAPTSIEWPIWDPERDSRGLPDSLREVESVDLVALEEELDDFTKRRKEAVANAGRARVVYRRASSEGFDPHESWDVDEPHVREAGVSGADSGRRIGSVVHRALARLTPSGPDDVERVVKAEAETEALGEDERQRAEELVRSCLSLGLIARAHAAPRYWKEVPVTLCERGQDGWEVTQGVCDLVFEQGEDLVLVDYKTDRVAPGSEDETKAKYRRQMGSYVRALRAATGREVVEAWLCLLGLTVGPQEVQIAVTPLCPP